MENFYKLAPFFPISILFFFSIVIMIFISFKRHHFTVFLLTVGGLLTCLSSFFLIDKDFISSDYFLIFINNFSLFCISSIIFSSIIFCFFSYLWLEKNSYKKEEFYLLLLFSTIGAMSLIIANHVGTMFISIELLSLPILGLIGYNFSSKISLESAIKYFIISSLTIFLFLFGITILNSFIDNFNFFFIKEYFFFHKKTIFSNSIVFGIVMVVVAFFCKLSLFPFHSWISDVYKGSSFPVLFYFSTVVKISVLFAFLNFLSFFLILKNVFFYKLIKIVSLLSLFFGSIMAMSQRNLKKMLAFSSIFHFGCFVLPFVFLGNSCFLKNFIVFNVISYILNNLVLMGSMVLFSFSEKDEKNNELEFYKGLFYKDPFLASSIAISIFSFIGIPSTIGFFTKFYFLLIMLSKSCWLIGFIFLCSSVISLFYYLRFISFLFLRPKQKKYHKNIYVKGIIYFLSRKLIFFSSFLIFLFGLFPQIIINFFNF